MGCTVGLIHHQSDSQEITAFRQQEASQSSSQMFYSGPAESVSRLNSTLTTHFNITTSLYTGADKSLARPERKQATFLAFYGTWSFITIFTRVAWIAGSKPAGDMDVCCKCCVLSGRGLCVRPITRPEESYRMWSV